MPKWDLAIGQRADLSPSFLHLTTSPPRLGPNSTSRPFIRILLDWEEKPRVDSIRTYFYLEVPMPSIEQPPPVHSPTPFHLQSTRSGLLPTSSKSAKHLALLFFTHAPVLRLYSPDLEKAPPSVTCVDSRAASGGIGRYPAWPKNSALLRTATFSFNGVSLL